MKQKYLETSHALFNHISRYIDYYSKIIGLKRSSKKQWYKYTDLSDRDIEITFSPEGQQTNIELSLKINNQWERWVKVKQSQIPGAGNGLFSSRFFKNNDPVTLFMGKRLSLEEITNNLHSNYAMEDIEPCNSRDEMLHFFFLAQLINHGNYTVANIRFDGDKNGYCCKDVDDDKEFLLDYQRPIHCNSCWEYRENCGELKKRRVIAKVSKQGLKGKCSMCKCREKMLILRECPQCFRQLCFKCYDKLQIQCVHLIF